MSVKFYSSKIIFTLSKSPFSNNIAILEIKIIYFCLRSNFCGWNTLIEVEIKFSDTASHFRTQFDFHGANRIMWTCAECSDTSYHMGVRLVNVWDWWMAVIQRNTWRVPSHMVRNSHRQAGWILEFLLPREFLSRKEKRPSLLHYMGFQFF